MAQELTYQSEYTGQQMDAKFGAVAQLQEAVTELQTAVAAKYSKPADGIPSTDMDADVNAALAKANSAIQSLADYYTKSEVDALIATINGQQYVDVSSLPTASASTMGKIYLVGPDASGYYSYYYTSYDGSAYSWVGPLGTTQISLANYAAKSELNQLDQKVDALEDGYVIPDYTLENGKYINDSGNIASYGTLSLSSAIPLKKGETIVVATEGNLYAIIAEDGTAPMTVLVHAPSVNPGAGVAPEYSYTADQDIDVRVSVSTSHYSIRKKWSIVDEIERLDKEIEGATTEVVQTTQTTATESGYGISAIDGTKPSKSNWYASDFIPIPGGVAAKFLSRSATSYGVAFYSSNSESSFISGVVGTGAEQNITVPATANYYRICDYTTTRTGYLKYTVVSALGLKDRVTTLEAEAEEIAPLKEAVKENDRGTKILNQATSPDGSIYIAGGLVNGKKYYLQFTVASSSSFDITLRSEAGSTGTVVQTVAAQATYAAGTYLMAFECNAANANYLRLGGSGVWSALSKIYLFLPVTPSIEGINSRLDEMAGADQPSYKNPVFPYGKNGIKALVIGNSYTNSSTMHLSGLISAGSVPTAAMSIYRAYISGAGIDDWIEKINGVSGTTLTKVAGDLNMTDSGTMKVILAQDWDVIVITQNSDAAYTWSNFANIKEYVGLLRRYCTNQRVCIAYQMPWAHANSDLNYSGLVECAKNMAGLIGVDYIIPVGMSVRNARNTSLEDAYDLTSDGTHVSPGVGQYVVSCSMFQSLISPVYGTPMVGINYNVAVTEQQISEDHAVAVTDDNRELCQLCAFYASIDMFGITEIDET